MGRLKFELISASIVLINATGYDIEYDDGYTIYGLIFTRFQEVTCSISLQGLL